MEPLLSASRMSCSHSALERRRSATPRGFSHRYAACQDVHHRRLHFATHQSTAGWFATDAGDFQTEARLSVDRFYITSRTFPCPRQSQKILSPGKEHQRLRLVFRAEGLLADDRMG